MSLYEDLQLRRALELEGLRRGAAARFVRLLNEGERDLVAALRDLQDDFESTPILTRARASRLEEAIAAIAALRAAAWGKVGSNLRRELRELADLELGHQQESLEEVLDDATVALPPRRVITAQPIQGRPLDELLAGLQRDDTSRISQAIRLAVASGAMAQLVEMVRGTRAAGRTDGILQIGRRRLGDLVRTVFWAVPATAKAAFVEANPDLFDYQVWSSVLDGKTSLICASRHGRGTPIGGGRLPRGVPPLEPPTARPPAHFGGCRSVMLVHLVGTEPLALGTFAAFFARQDEAFQRRWLGPSKYQLYRSGQYQVSDFVSLTGRELTLAELGA